MRKVAIIYWSGTGNTEAMAKALAAGVEAGGGAATLKPVGKLEAGLVDSAEALAFGCPSMGSEILEEEEMEPFIASLSPAQLAGKPLALFGSYDWGDGEWMRNWSERMGALGASLVGEGLIANLAPGPAELAACAALGEKLARA